MNKHPLRSCEMFRSIARRRTRHRGSGCPANTVTILSVRTDSARTMTVGTGSVNWTKSDRAGSPLHAPAPPLPYSASSQPPSTAAKPPRDGTSRDRGGGKRREGVSSPTPTRAVVLCGVRGGKAGSCCCKRSPPRAGLFPAEVLLPSAEFIPALLANTFIYYQSTSCSFQSPLGPAEQTWGGLIPSPRSPQRSTTDIY